MTPRDRDYAVPRRREACQNCGERDSHFCPPSFGDPGFYTCATPEEIGALFRAHDEDIIRNYWSGSLRYEMAKLRLAQADADTTTTGGT